jgi:hypothetical protein
MKKKRKVRLFPRHLFASYSNHRKYAFVLVSNLLLSVLTNCQTYFTTTICIISTPPFARCTRTA